MGYYIRVLSTSADCMPFSALNSELEKEGLNATLSGDVDPTQHWSQLLLSHSSGQEIAVIERNPVEENSLGSKELAEFATEIADCKPHSAATWLLDYFSRVRCLYALQVLDGTDYKNGWDVLGAV